jgi:hypothetical protein
VTGGRSTGLNVTYGIDFTKSNGRRKNPNSLHYLSKKYRPLVEDGCENENENEKMISSHNVYQRSIYVIGKILEEVFSSPAASAASVSVADNNRSDSEKKRSSIVPLSYSVYGFGAAVDSLQEDVSDCFSLHPQVASLPTLQDVFRVRILLFLFLSLFSVFPPFHLIPLFLPFRAC